MKLNRHNSTQADQILYFHVHVSYQTLKITNSYHFVTSKIQPESHMFTAVAMNTVQHKIVKIFKALQDSSLLFLDCVVLTHEMCRWQVL